MIWDFTTKCSLATKLQPLFQGPYTIQALSDQNATCSPHLGGKIELVHVSHLKPIVSRFPPPACTYSLTSPPHPCFHFYTGDLLKTPTFFPCPLHHCQLLHGVWHHTHSKKPIPNSPSSPPPPPPPNLLQLPPGHPGPGPPLFKHEHYPFSYSPLWM